MGPAAPAEEEAPDFGGEEEAQASAAGAGLTAPKTEAPDVPRRVVADYGDVVEDDRSGNAGRPQEDTKEHIKDDKDPKAEIRPGVVYMSGVQRLTRTHLEEVLAAKDLPSFTHVEWIGDEEVLLVFSSPEVAMKVLQSAREGFGDTMAIVDKPPGPGLWRAQRGYLEIRQATVADVPPLGFRRQHRGGRQVREYRFWTAMEDQSSRILDEEEVKTGQKRTLAVSSGEDALFSFNFSGDSGEDFLNEFAAPAAKRIKITNLQPTKVEKEGKEGDEKEDKGEGGFDLLDQMAQQDQQVLEQQDKSTAPPSEVFRPNQAEADWWGNWGSSKGSWGNWGSGSQNNDWSSWQDNRRGQRGWDHDDRGGESWNDWNNNDWGQWGQGAKRRRTGDGQGTAGGRTKGGGGGRGPGGERGGGNDAGAERGRGGISSWGAVDDAEKSRRDKRNARFAGGPPVPAKEE